MMTPIPGARAARAAASESLGSVNRSRISFPDVTQPSPREESLQGETITSMQCWYAMGKTPLRNAMGNTSAFSK